MKFFLMLIIHWPISAWLLMMFMDVLNDWISIIPNLSWVTSLWLTGMVILAVFYKITMGIILTEISED